MSNAARELAPKSKPQVVESDTRLSKLAQLLARLAVKNAANGGSTT